MTALLLSLFAAQDVEQQIDDSLRRFEAAVEIQRALAQLSDQLVALGEAATSPIARRLADDLRDGMASAAVPALIDALADRPEALPELQAAFRNAATSAAGRIALANALAQLDDTMSWREGIRTIASDPRGSLPDRLRALGLLLMGEDPGAIEEVRTIAKGLPGLAPADQRRVAGFLAEANTPETRELLADLMENEAFPRDHRLAAAEAILQLGDTGRADAARRAIASLRPGLSVEEPRVTVVDAPARRSPVSTPPRPGPQKSEDEGLPLGYKITFGAAAAGLALLLLVLRRRE